ncbi:hypothetical protein WDZ17_08300 [Pseudokineococcus basanitobsidens]|uniref:Ribosome maturation factor RimP n=1 Tax=Pseudokineococcus basanitobsidens TaxID=1926649 RepID=A0ABU8RJM8_9ACTN
MASSAPSRPEELTRLLDPVVRGAGLVLEGVAVTPAGRRRVVRVTVDLPDDEVGSVPHERVADVSRTVSTALDDAGAFGEQPYLLEVGSPGVGRPLTEPRHWRRARTRLVEVDVTGDDGTVRRTRARVVDADAGGVVLADGDGRTRLTWERLGAGAVQVEFRRPADEDDGPTGDEPEDDEPTDDEPTDDGLEDDEAGDDDGSAQDDTHDEDEGRP